MPTRKYPLKSYNNIKKSVYAAQSLKKFKKKVNGNFIKLYCNFAKSFNTLKV